MDRQTVYAAQPTKCWNCHKAEEIYPSVFGFVCSPCQDILTNAAVAHDELSLRFKLHGRGLDTLPLKERLEIQDRFAKYGTAGLFSEAMEEGNTVTLADNLTVLA